MLNLRNEEQYLSVHKVEANNMKNLDQTRCFKCETECNRYYMCMKCKQFFCFQHIYAAGSCGYQTSPDRYILMCQNCKNGASAVKLPEVSGLKHLQL